MAPTRSSPRRRRRRGGACIGSGIGPTRIGRVLGITKAYATRVGSGPFPTELVDQAGDHLRTAGREFGTTTGRARRCGWLDLVALRYAVRVNGMTHLALTKLDVLDSLAELQLCTAYRCGADTRTDFPADETLLATAQPLYEMLPGWQIDTSRARTWTDLPDRAMAYIARIEDFVRVPVALVSVGADRLATFSRLAVWEGF